MDNPFFSYTPIVQRPDLQLPNRARVGVWLGINIEHYTFGRPALSLAPFTAELVPDPLNYGWRDYGPRVGIWRIMRILDELGVPATGILNSEVCEHYPQIVEEGTQRGWAWVAHGANNSTWQTMMDPDEERDYITSVLDRIEKASGQRPDGWLGPALTASMNTYRLLAELGCHYVLDWANDDLPYDLQVPDGRLLSVPYASEINDIPLFAIRNMSGPEFHQAIVDQFEVLYEEGAATPRVLGIGLHPFLVGQPFRAKYLASALEHICSFDNVWITTSDEIAAWYLDAVT